MSQPWHLSLLGELRVQRGEQVITRFKYQKVGGLLAYLAFHPRQMHSREILIDLFWSESYPDAARNNLSTALSSLRSQLEPPGTPAGTVLRADRYSVGINSAMMTTDVSDFENAVREAERSSSSLQRVQSLEHAVGLYQGRLLPGYYEDWILPEQERLAGLFFDTVSLLIQHLEGQHDLPSALRYARQAVSVDPLREEAHQHLMRLLAATGQPGAALRQFKELERLLEEEMGEEPSAPLRALYRQIEKQSGLTAPALLSPVTATYVPVTSAPALISHTPYPTTLTLLMTDWESPSRQWEQESEVIQAAREIHHRMLRGVFARFGGQELKANDNGFLVAFSGAKQALSCAVAVQQALAEQTWPDRVEPAKVRMAIHTGDVERHEGDYQGETLHRASRMLTAGHSGQILVSNVTAELVRRDLSDEVRLVDMGVYRLRDVPNPERLFQVEYPGVTEATFPPLSAEAGYQTNLPVQVTRFFGREEEIAQIVEILRSEEVRLMTLTGPGGTGKTRLALEVAALLADVYQGAVWFVGLGSLTDAGLISSTLLSALQLSSSPQQAPLEQAVAFLSQQPSLLVLDNFEHLVEEGVVVVQSLWSRVPSLTLLVTSRQVLGLSGERTYTVAPLPTPNGGEGLEQLSLFDSVRLFVDRAQAVKPEFQVTSYNAPAIAELCQRLEGIPLAIELAAARVEVLPPSQMLAQLSDRFKLLTTRRRDVSARHRTLEAAIDWSYQLLSPELQRFFSRLSVFRGGWTVEAAESVCEEVLALDYLAQLRDHSLVLSEETVNDVRFRMLETVREFAQDWLRKAAEEEGVRKRQADFFLRLAVECFERRILPEEADMLNRLETEHDNLRAVLSWCADNEQRHETGWQLTQRLGWFWAQRGHRSEGRNWFERFMEAATAAGSDAWWFFLAAGNLAGDNETARSSYERSLTLIGWPTNRDGCAAGLLNNLGTAAIGMQDYATAGDYLEQSLDIATEVEATQIVAMAHGNLGRVAFLESDFHKARQHHEEALRRFRLIQYPGGIAGQCVALAEIDCMEGNVSASLEGFRESLRICQQTGDRGIGIVSLDGLAWAAFLAGEPVHAGRLLGAAEALRSAHGLGVSYHYENRLATLTADVKALLEQQDATHVWEAGRAMTWEEAVAYALTEVLSL